jgi:hypothetical protein
VTSTLRCRRERTPHLHGWASWQRFFGSEVGSRYGGRRPGSARPSFPTRGVTTPFQAVRANRLVPSGVSGETLEPWVGRPKLEHSNGDRGRQRSVSLAMGLRERRFFGGERARTFGDGFSNPKTKHSESTKAGE